MSFIGSIKTLYNHLKRGARWANMACKVASHLVAALNASNASDALKAQAVAWQTATNNLCDAIQTFIDGLPGNRQGE